MPDRWIITVSVLKHAGVHHSVAQDKALTANGQTGANGQRTETRTETRTEVPSFQNDLAGAHVDHVIRVPKTHEVLSSIAMLIPLQLLAYHAAVARNCDVDQPRNLAKSVTVE